MIKIAKEMENTQASKPIIAVHETKPIAPVVQVTESIATPVPTPELTQPVVPENSIPTSNEEANKVSMAQSSDDSSQFSDPVKVKVLTPYAKAQIKYLNDPLLKEQNGIGKFNSTIIKCSLHKWRDYL